ncbi:MAG: tRNA (adenosine(37)-N6)-threonylcarbamoyltransferase complex ATPase subunit type 1 TsaE, partial [Bacteroidota bacterium]|nr:tRNA (adenosine(37)-N6)-threonylcarbamoyltransferase complex ATPase subunit type 1 TsaE [Bacteroidota bacterium]
MKSYSIISEEELKVVAADIIDSNLNHASVFALYGKMGSGKTALIKAFCDVMKCSEKATSPTFAIVNEYKSPDHTVFHFDFYRIESAEEAFDLGYEEYFYNKDALVFIEWPELIEPLLPHKFIEIHIVE